MATPTKKERQTTLAASTTEAANDNTPQEGDNLPAFGLPHLENLVPNRGTFQPEIPDALALHKEAIEVLREVDSFSLKGDTGIYSRLTRLIAELCWQHTQGMGAKEGVSTTEKGPTAITGIRLSFHTTKGFTPNPEAWKDLRALFLAEVDKCTTEEGKDFRATMESPSIQVTLPACYRAGVLMCLGVGDIRLFKRGKRPELGIEAELEGTVFDPKKHVKAPAAPCNVLQPDVVYKPAGKVGKGKSEPNPNRYYTYMSGPNATLVYDRIFSKSVNETVIVDEVKGTLKRKPVKKGAKEKADAASAPSKVEVHLGEGSKPEDVWAGMQAMGREMKTGEIKIPFDIQKQAVSMVQEMVENLDNKGIENMGDALVELQIAIEAKCEASGVAINIFEQASDRLKDIKNLARLPDDERKPIMALYQQLDRQIKAAAA